MKKFAALLKVCLSSMLLTFTGGGRGKRRHAATGIGVALLIAGLVLYISGTYSFLLMQTLAPMGMERLVFLLMGIAALMSGMLLTAFGSSATVFGTKDNDLMLSMPVSTTMLLTARVAAVYLENLLFSFFMMVPAGVAYAVLSPSGGGRSVAFWLRLIGAVLTLPLLDTALALVVGAAIVWFSAKMPNKMLGKNLLMALWIALVFWISFGLSSGIETISIRASSVEQKLGWALPVVWMTDGMMGDGRRLAMFVLLCVAAFALMTVVLGRMYRKIASMMDASSTKSNYRMTAQSANGVLRALMAKEARRFFGTPVYLWNCGLGLMMLVVMGAAALIKRADLRMLLDMPELSGMTLPILCAIMTFLLSMSAVCAPSFSLEGKRLWILRTAPVSEAKVIGVKVGFQLMLALPCIAVAIVCLSLALRLSAAEVALLCLFCAVEEGMLALMGGWVGLWLAKPEVPDAVVVKQSLLSFVSMFGPIVLMAGVAALSWGLCSSMGMLAIVGAATAMTAAIGAAFSVLLVKKGPQRLQKMG